MNRNRIAPRPRPLIAAMAALGLAASGCQRVGALPQDLPPAYTSNQITDPALHQAAEEIRTWAAERTGADEGPLYSKVEVLPPVPTVQPYGVGVYQQEVRLPVILTTGPGWADLTHEDKEARAAEAFHGLTERLKALDHQPTLMPTLTIQTPEGMELSWINHLDPGGNNVHGDQ